MSIISLDSDKGKEIGFTSDLFNGYLWEKGKSIYISVIESRVEGKGHLSKLFQLILEKGYTIKVPTALPRMEAICKRKGFKLKHEYCKEFGESIEVWIKKP